MTAAPRAWLIRIVALITASSGMIAILQPLSERLHGRFGMFITPLTPFDYDTLNRSTAIFLGFILIYFSAKLLQRKIVAWWTALVTSIIIIAVHVLSFHSPVGIVLPLVTIGVLLATKDEFRVKSEADNIRQGLKLLALSLVVALLYGIIGFWFLEKRDFGKTFGLREAATQTFEEYTLFGNPDLVPHTRHARWFLESLGIFGAVSVGFGIYSLFRPLAYQFGTLPSERHEVEEILHKHGDSPEDFFKLWPEDKSYYFSHSRQAFIAYRVAAGVAIILNDPVGPAHELPSLLKEFIEFSTANGWTSAFVDVPASAMYLFKPFNLRDLKIGEDAIVDLENFATEVATNKHFRHISNRFEREGYAMELHQPPHDRLLLNEIQRVSDEWLELPGREERGFALGYFNRRYLQTMPLYLVRNDSGQIVAFANRIPSYHSPITTIDLMRHSGDAAPNTMDYLFMQIMLQLHQEGAKQFSLGLAPLSGMGEGDGRSPEERLLGYLYRSGGRLFSFKGLRQFKNKFEPEWQEKFLVYSGGPSNLAQIALALSQVLKVR